METSALLDKNSVSLKSSRKVDERLRQKRFFMFYFMCFKMTVPTMQANCTFFKNIFDRISKYKIEYQ